MPPPSTIRAIAASPTLLVRRDDQHTLGTDICVKGPSLVCAIFCVAVSACATEPVRISDQCHPQSDAVLVHPLDFTGRFSIGLVDGHLLFSYVALTENPDRPAVTRGQWFDADLVPETDEFWLGDSRGTPAWRWVAFDHRLFAQIWAVPDDSIGLPAIRRHIAIYAIAPGSTEFRRVPRSLPITTYYDSRLDLTPVSIGSSFVTSGADARAPVAVGHGRPVFAVNAIPSACPLGTDFTVSPLLIFDEETEYVHLYGDDPCNLETPGDDSREAHDATLVSLQDDGLGIFYRLGSTRGKGRLYYSRIGPDLRVLDVPPTLVGSTTRHFSIPGGYQARAAQLGSGPILFTERTEENDTNVCSNLRLVEPDGANARNAPWQLDCWLRPGSLRALAHAPTISAWIAVEPLAGGHAAIAYGERTSFPPGLEYVTRLTSDVEWSEGVFLTTIDEHGRRAAEVVRVTPPESTATVGAEIPRTATEGPYPGDFEVLAATEGDIVVVAWRDLRPDAPGYYARRFRCSSIDD